MAISRERLAHVSLATSAALAGSLAPTGDRLFSAALGALLATFGIMGTVVSKRTSLFVPTIANGSRLKKQVALTFDDGPDARFTPRVLDLLAGANVRATFFLVGERVVSEPSLARRIVAEGHAVGAHTMTHSHAFHLWRPARQCADIRATIAAIEAATGVVVEYFRPPQGFRPPQLAEALSEIRVACVTWNVRGGDAMGATSAAIVTRVAKKLARGSIVALHDGAGYGGTYDRNPTLDALPILFALLEQRGLRAVSLHELLDDTRAERVQ